MKNTILSNQPPKGTYDWYPEEFAIRKYIFDTWRDVCIRFGYEEYMTPVLESADVYRAKSGEDVGGKELLIITDRAGRELAIRPEMTPSVTRMVSKIYGGSPKPIRYFSIANFYRDQKPQRGRNKEFWQLNYDIFGSDELGADIEIIQIALEIMLAFDPPKGSFVVYINNRRMIDAILNDIAKVDPAKKAEIVRALDKWDKLSESDFIEYLSELGLQKDQIDSLLKFMKSEDAESLIQNLPVLSGNQGYLETKRIIDTLTQLGYGDWIKFQPNIIRGFDYYDGMVFEVFDNNPQNNRSLFGGGRYGGLASIFGSESFPAVGCAPGDETTKLFLEAWGLLDDILDIVRIPKFYIPLLDESLSEKTSELAQDLREIGFAVELGLKAQSVGKAIKYANSRKFSYLVLLGEDEIKDKKVTIKNLDTGVQNTLTFEDAVNQIFSELDVDVCNCVTGESED